MEKKNIANLNELEFVIFCIENIALKLKVNAEEVYIALTEKSSILNDYIVPEYETLHTQSKEYYMKDRTFSGFQIKKLTFTCKCVNI